MPVAFDGIRRPRIQVLAAFGGILDPGPTYLHLGVGPGLGTGLLAGGAVDVDITADVRSISIGQRGRDSDIDPADPVTCQIVLSNRHGNYDVSNPNTPYWGPQLLTANQQGLESGATTGWFAGSATTIASSTAQAYAGTRSLALTKTGSTGTLYANTPAVDLGQGASIPVDPGSPIRAAAQLRANSTGRPCRLRVAFYTAADTYIPGGDVLGAEVTDSSSGWIQATASGLTPEAAAAAAIEVQAASNGAGAVGEVHYADDITLQGTGLTDGTPIRVRASWADVAYDRFYGELSDITLDLNLSPDATATFECADGLEKLGRAYVPRNTPSRDGDTTGARIGYLADQALWPSSLRSIDTGYTTLGATTLGESALELMRKTESTEFGLLFVDGAGRLVFYDRYQTTTAARSTTVQATFADTGGTAVGITELSMARSRARSFNRVAITRDPNPHEEPLPEQEEFPDEPVEQVADDPVAQAAKGILSFPAEVGQLLRSDEEALTMAQGLIARFSTIQNRIQAISVNVLRGQWATLLALGPLDRVAVSRDYGPNTISTELLIQGVTEEISVSPLSWTLTFSTSNPFAAPDLWLLGTTAIGTGKLGW
jgi:hypothetical protein